MLTRLRILNFALIEYLELNFASGMTVITGETGAGKSIMIDALSIALGERADQQWVRPGCQQAEITLEVDLCQLPLAAQWLAAQQLQSATAPNQVQIRRIITHRKRTRAYINQHTVNIQQLKTLGNYLVDIYGQHQHQSLLKREQQLALLDAYGQQESLAQAVATAYHHWQNTVAKLQQCQHQAQAQQSRMALLQEWLEEFQALQLSAQEWVQLNEEHQRLSHADQLLSRCHAALELLYQQEKNSVEHLISKILILLSPLADWDKKIHPILSMLQSALIQVEEARTDLRHYHQQLEQNPERLQALEQRLSLIYDLARKHRCSPEQLADYYIQRQQEYASLQALDDTLFQLQQAVEMQQQDYTRLATTLSTHRQEAALALSAQTMALMPQLGMAGHFEIHFHPLPKAASQGLEWVEFMMSNNPGQPLQPLAKIASGGELSRIGLAIQVIAAHSNAIPTLIFDEVDVGIGGSVAERVGQLLRQLGQHRQILCITHLPQVAAQGQHHLQASKHIQSQQTCLQVYYLYKQQRIDEIARMLGGIHITAQTRSHAAEMIQRAQLVTNT